MKSTAIKTETFSFARGELQFLESGKPLPKLTVPVENCMVTMEALPPEEAALGRLGKPRFFMDVDMCGTEYLIPADKRMEWDAWDIACEHANTLLPVPEWAKPLRDQIRWVEFEMPVEVSI